MIDQELYMYFFGDYDVDDYNLTASPLHKLSLDEASYDLRTAVALELSILKWRRIVDRRDGISDCALCDVFKYRDEGRACEGCPVWLTTGRIQCDGSPFREWANTGYPHDKAIEERDFLIGLRLDNWNAALFYLAGVVLEATDAEVQ